MFRKATKSSCTSANEIQEKAEEDPHALNQHMKDISKWNTPVISCAAQVQEQLQLLRRI
jgi:hypothetical protein